MPMITYQPQAASRSDFVAFWSARYQYAENHLYEKNIGRELTERRVLDLFRWKNVHMPLAGHKLESVQANYIARLDEVKDFPENFSAAEFLDRFPDGGAIWRIFWLHCWRPARFPIYDQHVHRAMVFIKTGGRGEIPTTDRLKITAYLERYLPFHSTFAPLDPRETDKALWAFGKFLKENNFPVVPAAG